MTDYLYSVSLAQQTRLFLLSLGFGFFAGVIYDLFKAVRICLGGKKAVYIVTDVLYLTVLGFLNFLFFLSANEGEIRFFAFFGEALGFTVYLCTVGFTFADYFEKFINFIKRIFSAVFKILVFPFKKIWMKFNNFIKKHRKKTQKSENKSKYPLKVIKGLLYNFTDKKKNSENSESHSEGAEQSAD